MRLRRGRLKAPVPFDCRDKFGDFLEMSRLYMDGLFEAIRASRMSECFLRCGPDAGKIGSARFRKAISIDGSY